MPRVRVVDTNRGGFRTKKRLRNGQALLLDQIISHFGGPAGIAGILNINPQIPINWRNQGAVPPKMIGKVSKVLKIIPWALNYKFLADLELTNTPLWRDVVCGYQSRLDLDVDKILKAKHPDA